MRDQPARREARPRQSIGIRDLRAELATHLARVEAGETVIVTRGGRPAARLSPPSEPPSSTGYGLEDMARLGLVESPRSGPAPVSIADRDSATVVARPLPVDVRVDRIVRQVRG
ncbi:MAG: type II toxin-antitoxin system prevent-host-death family antitoxin [Acidimicrobiia bacterium]|nr:type II toxin-antitoxin system prevent-host-death family antitoxin [Acidimicrobiia bacterium]